MEQHRIGHAVYFTLKDRTPENTRALVDSCHKHLTDHAGVDFFSAGPRGEQFTRPVNDADFDVALLVVFESQEAHDAYQTNERHIAFVEENKPTWEKIRVFDWLF